MEQTRADKQQFTYVALASCEDELGLSFDDVTVIFACSEGFVSYLSVALQSIIDNASDDRHYDFVVLTRDLSPESMITLTHQVTRDNMGIGFLDVEAALGGRKLPHYGHFKPETYFRLLAPSLLPSVKKAIYLDSDLVALDDVAKLYDIDVSGHLLGATRDADTVGQVCGYDEGVGYYLAHDLGMSNPLDYFQAGVLLMNLEEFRRQTTPDQLLQIATMRTWRWLDQDVLNRVVDGNYVRIDMRWNLLYDWQGIRREKIIGSAPADYRQEYEAARQNPGIVHYAGADDRPWLYPLVDYGDRFWKYARRSPYIGTLRRGLERSLVTPGGLGQRARNNLKYKVGLNAFDVAFPPRTTRRKLTIGAYMRMGGSIG